MMDQNLPVVISPLIGRERELETASDLLVDERARLLTLSGPGGIGKTRLAYEIARRLRDEFRDGVYTVALGSIADPRLLPAAIARALHLQESGVDQLAQALKGYLATRHLLLVLDTFEHMLEAASLLGELLDAAPQLSLIVTSRAPLRLPHERVLAVPPLDLPDLANLPPLDRLVGVPAIALFLTCALRVRRNFALDAEVGRSVAQICSRLDGLPLAIELAAARVNVFSPAEILELLESPLTLLTAGDGILPDRQQTLRATISWSYALLGPEAQLLFRRLGVFVGGCALDAVAPICGHAREADAGTPLEVPALLETLIENSLLRREPRADGEPGLVMLEMLREFALEQLELNGEGDDLRRRHAEYYLALAEALEPETSGPEQEVWFDHFEREHLNLLAALGWTLERHEGALALRFVVALWKFWRIRSHQSVGRMAIEAALAGSTQLESAARSRAFYGAGWIAHDQGDYEGARRFFESSLALARKLGTPRAIAEALHGVGELAQLRGETLAALAMFEESLILYRQERDLEGVAWSLDHIGLIHRRQHNFASAWSMFQESLGLFRRQRHRWGMAISLLHGGLTLIDLQRYDEAVRRLKESLGIFQELGNKLNAAWPTVQLGRTLLFQGKYREATALYGEALDLFRELGNNLEIALALSHLGRLSVELGDYSQAARQLDEAQALFEELRNDEWLAFVYYTRSLLWERQGDLAQAWALAQQSLRVRLAQADQRGIAECLELLAAVRAGQGRPSDAALLYGAAAARRQQSGQALHPFEQPRHQQLLARLSPSGSTVETTWSQGGSMSADELRLLADEPF